MWTTRHQLCKASSGLAFYGIGDNDRNGPVLWPGHRPMSPNQRPEKSLHNVHPASNISRAKAAFHVGDGGTFISAFTGDIKPASSVWLKYVRVSVPTLLRLSHCCKPRSNISNRSSPELDFRVRDPLSFSKRFSEGAWKMICGSTTKSFRNSSTLSETIPQLQIIMFNTLCRVSLDMRDSEYLRLLGYKTESYKGCEAESYKTFAPSNQPELIALWS